MATELGVKRAFSVFRDSGYREPHDAERLMRGWIKRMDRFTDEQVVSAANRYADEDNSTWPKPGQLIARYLASQKLNETPRGEYDPHVEPGTIPAKWEKRILWRITGGSVCPATGRGCMNCGGVCSSLEYGAISTDELRQHHRWLAVYDWDGALPLAPWMAARIREHYELMGVPLTKAQAATIDLRTDETLPDKPSVFNRRFV